MSTPFNHQETTAWLHAMTDPNNKGAKRPATLEELKRVLLWLQCGDAWREANTEHHDIAVLLKLGAEVLP